MKGISEIFILNRDAFIEARSHLIVQNNHEECTNMRHVRTSVGGVQEHSELDALHSNYFCIVPYSIQNVKMWIISFLIARKELLYVITTGSSSKNWAKLKGKVAV